MPRRTQDPTRLLEVFVYRACTFCGRAFNPVRLTSHNAVSWSYYPDARSVWAVPVSLATTQGITIVFFSSSY